MGEEPEVDYEGYMCLTRQGPTFHWVLSLLSTFLLPPSEKRRGVVDCGLTTHTGSSVLRTQTQDRDGELPTHYDSLMNRRGTESKEGTFT